MKREFDTGFFAYRKCTIHEIFKIVPDFFLTVFSVIGNRTGQNFIHVTDKGLFSSIVDSGSDSCTENTIWLPSKIIDRNSGFSKSSGKFIVAFDPQIPGWFSEMDVGTFLKIGTACIRNSQMAACCFFFKFHNTIISGIFHKKVDCQIFDSHSAYRLHLFFCHFTGTVCLYFYHCLCILSLLIPRGDFVILIINVIEKKYTLVYI